MQKHTATPETRQETARILAGFLAIALIPAMTAPANADTVSVSVINFRFVPNNIVIELGDTVQWVWGSGTHTVTSGTGSTAPDVGALFDVPSNRSNTL